MAQPAPSIPLESLEIGDLVGEGTVGVSELEEVFLPVDMVVSFGVGVVGSWEEDLDGVVDILEPLLDLFLAGWSLKGGESLFRVLALLLALVMGITRPLGEE